MPEHGDVSLWLEHGGTKAQLLERAKAGRVPSKGYELVRASDIQPENIDWLWYGHLAANKLELLAGVPGAGKSQIQDVYVACVTTGVSWPDGANGQGRRNVIMLTAEDTLNDTLVPRLIAAGADRDRVWFLKCIRKDDKDRMFLLGEDLAELGRMIAEVGEVGLVTIDPITAYLGKLNSHMATDVRAQLGPLKDFAEQVQVGISAITHPPKNAGPSALDQFLGSQAFIAAARVGHLCVEEFEQDASGNRCPAGRMLYTRAKHNPTEPMASLAYRIITATGGTDHRTGLDVKTSKIVWEGLVDITANEALAATTVRKDRGGAVPFLMDMLSNGPVPKTLIDERAVVHAISESQLKTAKTKTGIVAGKEKGKIHGGWLWCLPQHASALEIQGVEVMSKGDWVVYEILPIDFRWAYLPTVTAVAHAIAEAGEKLVRSMLSKTAGGPYLDDELPVSLDAFIKAFSHAQIIARKAGWEGDFRGEPCVFWLPGDGTFDYAFVWKQENNGDTFVVSPVPLPWLEAKE